MERGNQLQAQYGYKKSVHVQALSLGVFLSLFAYYAIVVFHWDFISKWISSLSFPVLGYVGLTIFAASLKGGMALRIYRIQDSKEKAKRIVILVSFYLAVCLFSIGLLVKISEWLSSLFSGHYWQESHWFWIGLVIFIMFSILGFIIWRMGLLNWKMLQDLKAIPIVSPVFCFGAPVLWSKNLAFANLDAKLISSYSSLSILAGVIFLIYLVAFGVLNHKFSSTPQEMNSGIIDATGNQISSNFVDKNTGTIACLLLFGLGLFFFLLVLVDVLIQISIT